MFKKLVLVLCLVWLVLLCGCKSKNKEVSPDIKADNDKPIHGEVQNDKSSTNNKNNAGDTGKDNVNIDAGNKDAENNMQQESDVIEDSPFVNVLTGQGCTEEVSKNRPIAVMVNNIQQAMPQIGIAKADIVYEILDEGGITRLTALYKDYENIPEIGSVRSSRDYNIDISDAHDAIYVHCGGSTYAKDMLAQRKTNNIDGLYDAEFYRSAERLKTMNSEHTLMISGAGIKNVAQSKNYRTTSQAEQPLKFSKEYTMENAKTALHINVPFSLAVSNTNPDALSTFDYDSERGVYLKGHYKTTHIDGATNQQLAFTNVITLECNQNIRRGDPLGCLEVHFTGQGKGLYAVDGKIKPVVWKKVSRTTPYALYEEDGVTPLELKPGKSYIGIVPTGTKVSYN